MKPRVEVLGLFPTPFMRVQGLLDAEEVAALLDELMSARMGSNAKSEQLSHTAVIGPDANALYSGFSAKVLPAIVDFGVLVFGERLAWTIKEMWMNSLETGGQQAIHSHANSFVSGVAYLTESHSSARTIFYRELGGRQYGFANDNPDALSGPFNSPKWAVPAPMPGDVVLFPSYLLHEVPRNQGGRRATLAFNAIPDRLRSWGYEIRFSHARIQ